MKAPQQDLMFLKKIHAFAEVDKQISTVVTKKFSSHLWYLGDETIALAFFDDTIPIEEKRKMCQTLWDQPAKDESTRVFKPNIPHTLLTHVNEWESHHFITEKF